MEVNALGLDNSASKIDFDKLAPTYWLEKIFSLGLSSYWRACCVRRAHLDDADVICDLCTGTGECLNQILSLAKRSANVYAIDYSPSMLKRAEYRNIRSVNLLLEDVRATSLKSASVDAVICCFGWKLLSCCAEIDVVREIDRILKPGGRFAAVELISPKRSVVRWAQTFYLSAITSFASVFSEQAKHHRNLAALIKNFRGFMVSKEMFRELGYEVADEELSSGLVRIFYVTKPSH